MVPILVRPRLALLLLVVIVAVAISLSEAIPPYPDGGRRGSSSSSIAAALIHGGSGYPTSAASDRRALRAKRGLAMADPSSSSSTTTSDPGSSWSPSSSDDRRRASELGIDPLDEYNANLLDEVRPRGYANPSPLPIYDLVVIGSGAGGLVSSRQAARRGGTSAMISAKLSGGDCLNAGCVPSKALLRAARLVREVRLAVKDRNFGVMIGGEGIGSEGGGVSVDFPRIMERMRRLRAEIAPVDGHARGSDLGVQTFQGFGRFVSPDTVEVVAADDGAGGTGGGGVAKYTCHF